MRVEQTIEPVVKESKGLSMEMKTMGTHSVFYQNVRGWVRVQACYTGSSSGPEREIGKPVWQAGPGDTGPFKLRLKW